jgi:hypothetical protein
MNEFVTRYMGIMAAPCQSKLRLKFLKYYLNAAIRGVRGAQCRRFRLFVAAG